MTRSEWREEYRNARVRYFDLLGEEGRAESELSRSVLYALGNARIQNDVAPTHRALEYARIRIVLAIKRYRESGAVNRYLVDNARDAIAYARMF